MTKTRDVSTVVVFAALTAISDSVSGIPQLHSGIWYSWVFLMIPLNGIILGPLNGSLATLIGVFVGHFVYFQGAEEFLFTFGAAVGSAACGMIWNKRILPVIIFYTLGLASYFLTPISLSLPLWGMWDTYCAYTLLLSVGLMHTRISSGWITDHTRFWMAVCSLIGVEADVLFRIFLFIPMGTYQSIYGFPVEVLREIWFLSAASTPIQAAMSVLFTCMAAPTLLGFVQKRVENTD